jgi:hypothetical protein
MVLDPVLARARRLVDASGGALSIGELAEALFGVETNSEGSDGSGRFVEFLLSLDSWVRGGLSIGEDGAAWTSFGREVARWASTQVVDYARSIASACSVDGAWFVELPRLSDLLATGARQALQCEALARVPPLVVAAAFVEAGCPVVLQDGVVYSQTMYQIRRGSLSAALRAVIRAAGGPIHFRDAFAQVRGAGRDCDELDELTIRGAVAGQRDLVQSGYGEFTHRDHWHVPFSLIVDVRNWVSRWLREQSVPFVGVAGAFEHFEVRCRAAGLLSEHALYYALREEAGPQLSCPRAPYLSLPGIPEDDMDPVTALEAIVRDRGGSVALSDFRDLVTRVLFLKGYRADNLNASAVLVRSGQNVVHIDHIALDSEALKRVVGVARSLADGSGRVSTERVFAAEAVTCRLAGIREARVLHRVLDVTASRWVTCARYPLLYIEPDRITRSTPLGQHMADFILASGDVCSMATLIGRFHEREGFSESSVYSLTVSEKAWRHGLCRYGQGSLVHLRTIGWCSEKESRLSQAADAELARSAAAGRPYGLLTALLESSALPDLDGRVGWTKRLVEDLLAMTGRYRVLGNLRTAYTAASGPGSLANYAELAATLLRTELGGATSIARFAEFLERRSISRGQGCLRGLRDSGPIKVSRDEVALRELG